MTRPLIGFVATLAACMSTAPAIADDADIDVTLSQELDNGISSGVNVDTSITGAMGRDAISVGDTSITGGVSHDRIVAPATMTAPSIVRPALKNYTFDLGPKK